MNLADLGFNSYDILVEIREKSFDELRKGTKDKWQERRKINFSTGNWTKKVIANVRIWTNRKFGEWGYTSLKQSSVM